MTATNVEFDPFSDEYFNDPSEMYRRLRDEAPVYYSEKYGFYALSRFADVLAAHRDWQAFSSAYGIELFTLGKADRELVAGYRSIIMMDPPEHDRLRALVSRVFTPAAITALEPMIREVISSFLDPVRRRDGFDVVSDFAGPFPVEVISRMIGIPEGERQKIRHRIDISLHREPGQLEPDAGEPASHVGNGRVLVRPRYEEARAPRRRHAVAAHASHGRPRRRHRIRARRRGDRRLRDLARWRWSGNRDEARRQRRGVVLAAPRPVAEGGRRPRDDPSRRRRDPSVRAAVAIPRPLLGQDREFEGGTIPAGHPVLLITGSATRDPREFEHPDDFDIGRPPNVAIGFGHGVHSCLGAALARMESRVAIEELAARWKRLEVDESGLRRVQMSNVAGYSNVPVRAVR